MRRDKNPSQAQPQFRTLAITTLWDAEQAEQLLVFLDELSREVWQVHGEQIQRRRHEEAAQGSLDLEEELPF